EDYEKAIPGNIAWRAPMESDLQNQFKQLTDELTQDRPQKTRRKPRQPKPLSTGRTRRSTRLQELSECVFQALLTYCWLIIPTVRLVPMIILLCTLIPQSCMAFPAPLTILICQRIVPPPRRSLPQQIN